MKKQNWFNRRKKRVYQARNKRTLGFQTLETRCLMAGDVPSIGDPTAGVVTVDGTDFADRMEVRQVDDQLEFIVRSGRRQTVVKSIAADQVSKIVLNGYGGNDRITVDPSIATSLEINGGNGHDHIIAGNGDDVINGGDGNDTIYGREGSDTIDGGEGNDRLHGEVGADLLRGGNGADRILGGNDNDIIEGGEGNDRLYGGSDNDIIFGGGGNDVLVGDGLRRTAEDGADILFGELGRDSLNGGGGEDFLDGGIGDEARRVLNADPNKDIGLRGFDLRNRIDADIKAVQTNPNAATVFGHGDGGQRDRLNGGREADTVVSYVPWAMGQAPGRRAFSEDIAVRDAADEKLTVFTDGVQVGNPAPKPEPPALPPAIPPTKGGGVQLGPGPTPLPVAGIVNGTLFLLDGSNGREEVTVEYDATRQKVILKYNSETLEFNASDIQRIQFNAGGGNDFFHNKTDIPSIVYGGDGDDVLIGGGGADELHGGAGNDEIVGHDGNDNLFGDDGNDRLQAGDGNDVLHGGAGNDHLSGDEGDDVLYGDDGQDELHGGVGDDVIYGGNDNDSLLGGYGNDRLFGDNGNDFIRGEWGNDVIDGGAGVDSLYGDSGDDRIEGGDDSDQLFGGTGDDLLSGGGGNDSLFGESGNDELHGGAGNDVLRGGDGNDSILGGFGSDHIYGDAGNDILRGEWDNDEIFGGLGNDQLFGGSGNDRLDGGPGIDRADGGSGVNQIFHATTPGTPPIVPPVAPPVTPPDGGTGNTPPPSLPDDSNVGGIPSNPSGSTRQRGPQADGRGEIGGGDTQDYIYFTVGDRFLPGHPSFDNDPFVRAEIELENGMNFPQGYTIQLQRRVPGHGTLNGWQSVANLGTTPVIEGNTLTINNMLVNRFWTNTQGITTNLHYEYRFVLTVPGSTAAVIYTVRMWQKETPFTTDGN